MSKRDDQVSLKDMRSHACKAVELLGKTGRENLGRDRVMQLALTRLGVGPGPQSMMRHFWLTT